MVSFRRFLQDSGWVLSANALGAVLSLIQSVLITRALGVELFGIYALVVASVTVVNQLTSFRMNDFIVKYVSEAQARKQQDRAAAAVKVSVLLEVAASVVAFALALLLAAPVARWVVGSLESSGLIALYSLTILANVLAETSAGVFHVFDRFATHSRVTVVQRLFVVIGVVVAVASGMGLEGILLWSVVMVGLGSALQVGLAGRELTHQLGGRWWRTPLSAMRGHWRPALQFAFSTNVGAKLGIITKDADVLWLGLFRTATEAGLYRVATSLGTVALMPVAPLAQTIYPQLAQAVARSGWNQFRLMLRRATGLAAAYTVPVVVLMMVTAPWMIAALYGDEFGPASLALRLLLPGLGYASVFIWSRPALLAIHRPDFAMWVSAVVALLKIAGILILVPLWGYAGNAGLVTGLYFFGVTVCVWKLLSELRHASDQLTVPIAETAPG